MLFEKQVVPADMPPLGLGRICRNKKQGKADRAL